MKPTQSALLEKAADSLLAAKLLLDNDLFDFAASRAYYAMFYAAEALLLEENLAFSKHAAVISAFGQHFVKTGRLPADLHRALIEAQDLRNVGDYDIGPTLSKEQAEHQMAEAERFITLLQAYLEER